jgi:hypothetical protein
MRGHRLPLVTVFYRERSCEARATPRIYAFEPLRFLDVAKSWMARTSLAMTVEEHSPKPQRRHAKNH